MNSDWLECTDNSCKSPGTPFWGGVGTTSYKIFLAIHILAIISAFGPTLLFAIFNREASKRKGEAAQLFAALPLVVSKRVSFPAFLVAALSGIVLVLDSSDFYSFEKPWVSAAFSIVILVALVYYFMLWPAQRRLVAATHEPADETADAEFVSPVVRSARVSVAIAGGLMHVGMVCLVVLMVWKPGQ